MSDVKQAFGSPITMTFAVQGLASDTNLLAGRESNYIDTTSGLYLDYLVGGKVKTGTSPTVNRTVELWVWGQLDDTPTYPDAITGVDGNKTLTTRDIMFSGLVPLHAVNTDATSGRTYYIRPLSIASAFGGVLPKKWGLFLVHNTAVALDGTGGSFSFTATPVYQTVA